MPKKRTDDTQGKLLRKQEPKSNSWSYNLYLSQIDDNWENLGYSEIHRAYDIFLNYAKHKVGYAYACILHDRDKQEDGQDKKPHIHFIVRLNHNVTLSWAIRYINDMFGTVCTECVYAEVPYKLEHYIDEYLLHIGYLDKYQYDRQDLTINGSMFDISYQDFMTIIGSCETFRDAYTVCQADKTLSKMFVKHCYFVRSVFDGNRSNNNNTTV